ncbi:MAG: helix-turn-helix domain-containing protein [Microvirga sp.]
MDLSIGELSRLTAVKVPTIRYYEQVGLLAEPVRTMGGQRRYGDPEVKRLHFIRHARELGFEMDDIRELLELSARPNQSCHEADSIAGRNLAAIERRIRQLEALRGELRRMVDECRHGRICDCRVIEVLADHGQCHHDHH